MKTKQLKTKLAQAARIAEGREKHLQSALVLEKELDAKFHEAQQHLKVARRAYKLARKGLRKASRARAKAQYKDIEATCKLVKLEKRYAKLQTKNKAREKKEPAKPVPKVKSVLRRTKAAPK